MKTLHTTERSVFCLTACSHFSCKACFLVLMSNHMCVLCETSVWWNERERGGSRREIMNASRGEKGCQSVNVVSQPVMYSVGHSVSVYKSSSLSRVLALSYSYHGLHKGLKGTIPKALWWRCSLNTIILPLSCICSEGHSASKGGAH